MLTDEQHKKLESWCLSTLTTDQHAGVSGSALTAEKYNELKGGLSIFTTEVHHSAKSAFSFYCHIVNGLKFHLHNMLLVAVWGAFEGYMQGALAELFAKRPYLLSSSDKKISIEEVINNRENVVEYVIAKEIDEIGRKNLKELQSYIRGKLKIQFSNQHFERMQDVYFLRNVISHSAGFLRKDQLGLVPKDVDVCNLELKISQSYLNETLDCITKAVCQFHVQVKEKFGFSV